MSSQPERRIVVIGGGIIGCCAAYYLSHHKSFSEASSITVLEASTKGPAQGASGKAGGLVATWAYPPELADVSFREHVMLAKEYGGEERWGWRFVGCGTWEGRSGEEVGGEDGRTQKRLVGSAGSRTRMEKGLPDDLTWLDESLTDSYSPIADDGSTAQVHPCLFTTSMLKLAQSRGVQFITGKASAITQSRGTVTGVTYTPTSPEEGEGERTLEATNVILCAGGWSPSLIPDLPITAARAHSITIIPSTRTTISPYAIFTSFSDTSSSPEIYARPTNEVYACGERDASPLPPTVDQVQVDPEACEEIHQQVTSISKELKEGTVDKRQACYVPLGGPLIGEVGRGAKGLIVATGHNVWVSCFMSPPEVGISFLRFQGICNAPGTGKAIAELVFEGRIKCANLKSLEPKRYM